MGMALVLDVESETVERYPQDMPLCGKAMTADVYRKDSASSSDYTAEEVAGVAVGVFFGTLIVVAGGVYVYLKKTNAASRHEKMSDTADSHL